MPTKQRNPMVAGEDLLGESLDELEVEGIYDFLKPPKVPPGKHWTWAAKNLANPGSVAAKTRERWQKVKAQEGVDEWGYEDRSPVDGGFVDHNNNEISTGDGVLMWIDLDLANARRIRKIESIERMVPQPKKDFDRKARSAGMSESGGDDEDD